MSFSFASSGSVDTAKAVLDENQPLPHVPNAFVEAVRDQLDSLPEGSQVNMNCHGHGNWGDGQTAGQLSLHAILDVQANPE